MEHVAILADEAMEGRGAGSAGEAKAARYIAEQFEAAGLKPYADTDHPDGYIQPFTTHLLGGSSSWPKATSQNVIGVLPGTDPSRGYVVVGAHFDGQGMTGQSSLGRSISEGDDEHQMEAGDEIWNSAVDNAVSVATIIEIARHLANSKHALRRSILFVGFGSEESALDGSTYFVNRAVEDGVGIEAMINLEKLVGHEAADFLYVSYGTSTVFPTITESAVRATGVHLSPFFPGVIANTDHYPFVMAGIPAITIGTGTAKYIHTPSDEAVGLDYDLLATRSELVLRYLTELADLDSDIPFTGDVSGRFGALGGPATQAELESRKQDRQDTPPRGYKVTSVVRGSTADNAGIRPGDLVIEADGQPLPLRTFYQGLENLYGDETHCEDLALTILRGMGVVEIELPSSCQ